MTKPVFKCFNNCQCHYGIPFDQCECSCPSWCGNSEFNYVLQDDPEPALLLTEVNR